MTGTTCGAKTTSGRPCRRPAGWGTGHVGVGACKLHLGATQKHEKHWALERAKAEAIKYAAPIDIEPHDAILHMLHRAYAWVIYARERIEELQAEDLVGPVVTTRPLKQEKGAESRSERVEDHGPPAVHIWIHVEAEWADKVVTYSKTAIACGIAERRIQIAEEQAQMLADAMRQFAIALGFSPADPKVRTAMGQSLRLVAENGEQVAA